MPEKFFLIIGIPLTFIYLALVSPLRDYQHGTERFLHIIDYAEYFIGNSHRMPVGFLEVARRSAPVMLGRYGLQTKAWDQELHRKGYFSLSKKKISHLSKVIPRHAIKQFPNLTAIALQPSVTVDFTTHYNPACYPIVGYLPYIVPALIGIIAGLPPEIVLYLTLTVNAFGSLAFAYFLIRFTPALKWFYCFLFLLPSVFMMRVHVSPDLVCMEICLLLSAIVLHLRTNPQRLRFRGCAGLCVLSMLVGWVKITYFIFPALLWLIPSACFTSFKNKAVAVGLAVLLSGLLALAWNAHVMKDHYLKWVGMPDRPLALLNIVSHPLSLASDLSSVTFNGKRIVRWCSNAFFWNKHSAVTERWLIYPGVLCLFMLVLFPRHDNPDLSLTGFARSYCLALFIAIYIIIMLALELYMQQKIGVGVQGRYFIPILPLLAMAIYKPLPDSPYACFVARYGISVAAIVWSMLHITMFMSML